jgi:hypothetical protein
MEIGERGGGAAGRRDGNSERQSGSGGDGDGEIWNYAIVRSWFRHFTIN